MRLFFHNYFDQRNLARQFESCTAICCTQFSSMVILFLEHNIFHNLCSDAFKVWRNLWLSLYCKCTAASWTERILKIGSDLTKLPPWVVYFFLGKQCSVSVAWWTCNIRRLHVERNQETRKLLPEVSSTTLVTFFSARERELCPMTLTSKTDLESVKLNQRAKHLRQRLFSSKVIVWSQTRRTDYSKWTTKMLCIKTVKVYKAIVV